MKQVRRPRIAAILSAALVGMCTIAAADQPTTQPQMDTATELRALRARIDQLEKQQKDQEIKQEAATQQATANSVMTDAEKHSKLFDDVGITAGYKDNRFFIGSDDGNFMFRPWVHMQFRYVVNDRMDAKPGDRDDIENGFEMRRLRFGFDGNLFSPDFTYMFNWATVRANGTATVKNSAGATVGTVSNNLGGALLLEEAWVKYNFHDTPWYVKAGQIKDPLLHDQIVSSRYQQSNERSITADIFANGDGFTQGVTAIFDPKSWIRAEAGVTHGMRSANTNFLDPPTNAFDYGVAGRAEFKMFGRWQDYAQVGGVDIKQPLLVFGVGADYTERGHAGQTVMVGDAQFALPNGLNLYGAIVDRYTTHNFGIYSQSATGASIGTPDPAVADQPTNEYSALGEVGYVFHNRFEPFGRYEYMRLQGTPAGSDNYVQVITVGANIFFYGNRLKITPEVVYLPRGVPIDDTPSDTFASTHNHEELIAEIQLQVLL